MILTTRDKPTDGYSKLTQRKGKTILRGRHHILTSKEGSFELWLSMKKMWKFLCGFISSDYTLYGGVW